MQSQPSQEGVLRQQLVRNVAEQVEQLQTLCQLQSRLLVSSQPAPLASSPLLSLLFNPDGHSEPKQTDYQTQSKPNPPAAVPLSPSSHLNIDSLRLSPHQQQPAMFAPSDPTADAAASAPFSDFDSTTLFLQQQIIALSALQQQLLQPMQLPPTHPTPQQLQPTQQLQPVPLFGLGYPFVTSDGRVGYFVPADATTASAPQPISVAPADVQMAEFADQSVPRVVEATTQSPSKSRRRRPHGRSNRTQPPQHDQLPQPQQQHDSEPQNSLASPPAQHGPSVSPRPPAATSRARKGSKDGSKESQRRLPVVPPPSLQELHEDEADGDSRYTYDGASCHQCKTRRPSAEIMACTAQLAGQQRSIELKLTAKKKFRKRSRNSLNELDAVMCCKKYCTRCIDRFYRAMPQSTIPGWECPSCRGVCVCANCIRMYKLVRAADAAAAATSSNPPHTVAPSHSTLATPAAAAAVATAAAPTDSRRCASANPSLPVFASRPRLPRRTASASNLRTPNLPTPAPQLGRAAPWPAVAGVRSVLSPTSRGHDVWADGSRTRGVARLSLINAERPRSHTPETDGTDGDDDVVRSRSGVGRGRRHGSGDARGARSSSSSRRTCGDGGVESGSGVRVSREFEGFAIGCDDDNDEGPGAPGRAGGCAADDEDLSDIDSHSSLSVLTPLHPEFEDADEDGNADAKFPVAPNETDDATVAGMVGMGIETDDCADLLKASDGAPLPIAPDSPLPQASPMLDAVGGGLPPFQLQFLPDGTHGGGDGGGGSVDFGLFDGSGDGNQSPSAWNFTGSMPPPIRIPSTSDSSRFGSTTSILSFLSASPSAFTSPTSAFSSSSFSFSSASSSSSATPTAPASPRGGSESPQKRPRLAQSFAMPLL